MKFIREIHHRHSMRLRGFDYSSPGYYFVTICTQNRECIYGTVSQDVMMLDNAGKMVKTEWSRLAQRFTHLRLDNFVIMPNHFHGIIQIKGEQPFQAISDYVKNRVRICNNTESTTPPPGTPPNSISRILQAFKSISTVNYCEAVRRDHWPPFEKHLWQRNFYDHIIRNADELEIMREYILNNPANWQKDEDNPINIKKYNKPG